jgi:molybdopterin-binding protein
MSHIQADIIQIQNVENLHILTLQSTQNILSMMSLELNSKIQTGSRVILTVKPTAVAIAKQSSKDLSFSNQLPSKILSLELGELLCSLVVEFESYQIESIITTSEAQRMQLQVGMDIVTLINSSDLSIEEIL